MSTKVGPFDVPLSTGPAGEKLAKISLFMFALIGLNYIMSWFGTPPANAINQDVKTIGPLPIEALLTIVAFSVLTIVGCCGGVFYCVWAGFKQQSTSLMCYLSTCTGAMTFCSFLGFVTSFLGMGVLSGYNYATYCPALCTAQFESGKKNCNHTISTVVPMSSQTYDQSALVSKSYCDSKGTIYEGSWFELTWTPVYEILIIIVAGAVTYLACVIKPKFQPSNGAGANGTVVMTTQAAIIVQQPQIVSMVQSPQFVSVVGPQTVQIVQPVAVVATSEPVPIRVQPTIVKY
jgi:hypothetical protein